MFIKMSLIKGFFCGAIISIIITVSIILFFFIDMTEFYMYFISFISGVITLLFLVDIKVKNFLISFAFSILVFIITEIILAYSGVILAFFQLRYGAGQLPWAGDGFGMAITIVYCLIGSGVGTIVAFIVTLIKRKNLSKSG
jgi:hypothetical protein